ncbi:hypothetical protein HDU67_001026 [Dinochytrium kinnereticum]|nr:hypothetical protein HDU67_001026 [Dinochytrium kinnereticum]
MSDLQDTTAGDEPKVGIDQDAIRKKLELGRTAKVVKKEEMLKLIKRLKAAKLKLEKGTEVPEHVASSRQKEVEKLDGHLTKLKATNPQTATGELLKTTLTNLPSEITNILQDLCKSQGIETLSTDHPNHTAVLRLTQAKKMVDAGKSLVEMARGVVGGGKSKKRTREETTTTAEEVSTGKKVKGEREKVASKPLVPRETTKPAAKSKKIVQDISDDEGGDISEEDLVLEDDDFSVDEDDDDVNSNYDDVISDENDDSDDDDAPRPARKKMASTFVNSLGDGLSDVSLSDDDDDAIRAAMAELPKKVNRMGQRARRMLAEKKFGQNAKHLSLHKAPVEKNIHPERLAREEKLHPSWEAKRSRNPAIRIPSGKKIDFDEKPVKGDGGVKAKTKAASAPKLHPSWEAKKQLSTGIIKPVGKKIQFDDD